LSQSTTALSDQASSGETPLWLYIAIVLASVLVCGVLISLVINAVLRAAARDEQQANNVELQRDSVERAPASVSQYSECSLHNNNDNNNNNNNVMAGEYTDIVLRPPTDDYAVGDLTL
jgi:hypothetical protein